MFCHPGDPEVVSNVSKHAGVMILEKKGTTQVVLTGLLCCAVVQAMALREAGYLILEFAQACHASASIAHKV